MKELKQFFFAVLLLPVCYGATVAMLEMVQRFKNVPEGSFYFIAGIISYFAFQWIFFRPMRTYVFGHELSHAIAAWLSGADVKHFHVSKHGGSVTVSRSNYFIALAPYILPLYALIVMGVFFVISYFYPPVKKHWVTFLWLLGAALAFHMSLTSYALKQDQPDLKSAGKFLSAVIIYLGNAGAIIFMMGILFPKTVSWTHFAKVSSTEAVEAVKQVGKGTQVLVHGVSRAVQK